MVIEINEKEFDEEVRRRSEIIYNELIRRLDDFDNENLSNEELQRLSDIKCPIGKGTCDTILRSAIEEYVMNQYAVLPTEDRA